MTKGDPPLAIIRDGAIRARLVDRITNKHALGDTVKLFHELGIYHGRHRVDLALINGAMHGYEIKSEADTVGRLAQQAEAFSQVFDKMTAVVAFKHLEHTLRIVPDWWGIQVTDYDKSGQVAIRSLRSGYANPNVNGRALVELLWRDEALLQVQKMQLQVPKRGANRKYLYDTLVDQMPLTHLRRFVRETLKSRPAWRVAAPHE
jgi:hypothetical protein